MSSITGTGSKDSALDSGQHSSGSIADNPFFTGEVPEALLRDCENKRRDTLKSTVQKATNLYRRVSTVKYYSNTSKSNNNNNNNNNNNKHVKLSSAKCLVCLVTLVKSSKDQQRAGVKLRCQCNVRVCTTCFETPEWYLNEPHFTKCPTLPGFICAVCSCFEGVKEKVCCVWMCSGCSSERQTRLGSSKCLKCSGTLDRCRRRETRTLWCRSGDGSSSGEPECSVVDDSVHAEEKISDYRDVIRSRVFDKVVRSRHLSASDVRTLFHECFAPQVCTCEKENGDRNPMCASCTPVLTLMQLLAKNPRPLVASLAERAIPGRALGRNVYDRALLLSMLNDPDIPLCANGCLCKGMLLVNTHHNNSPKPLPSLISPESYNCFVSTRVATGEVQQIDPCRCILCLLFNQSAAVAQMVGPDGLYLEPHPSGPVYYFNVKISSDVGVPEVRIDEYQSYIVNFKGSVGSYKPTFYYNWRDMLKVLHRDGSGRMTFLPVQ